MMWVMPSLHGLRHRLAHPRLVDFVRAGIGNRHDRGRQAGGIELCAQDFLPHAMDRHPPKSFGHGGQRADHVELAARKTSCSANALSLPDDHEISAFARARHDRLRFFDGRTG